MKLAWVGSLTQYCLFSWQGAIYLVNSQQKESTDLTLTTPVNKGHESMAYLTYIIDHYYALPATIAFLHSHRSGFLQAWHVDAPLHDNVAAMRALQIDFVQRNGYINLRCNWNPGCKAGHRRNKHVTEQVWTEIFDGTSTPPTERQRVCVCGGRLAAARGPEVPAHARVCWGSLLRAVCRVQGAGSLTAARRLRQNSTMDYRH